ncbi:hypothetical protein Goshw_010742 [Gossypium schwendimanii]|uniref:Uncharacterized protein n=1 Tax=Gossypium schwendimanii TaxID=34291 RepID=A0A7J9MH59_GOSSC|nr:hypothetical protein [Gossypium schwendimanii]
MNGFSTVDGFVEITESLAEMIKYIANEPSLGLSYVQKHTRDTVPNLLNLSNRLADKSRQATLHAQDLEDSITMVSSMKQCGFPIADEMIKDITDSLTLISVKQLKRGLIDSTDSSFTMRRTMSWGPMAWVYGSEDLQQDGSNYFSTMFKSAREKASGFRWPQLESKEPIEPAVRCPAPTIRVGSASTGSIPDNFQWPQLESKEPIETESQMPVQCQPADKHHGEERKIETDGEVSGESILFVSEDYNDFKADKESKLEPWLEGCEDKLDRSKGESETGGV